MPTPPELAVLLLDVLLLAELVVSIGLPELVVEEEAPAPPLLDVLLLDVALLAELVVSIGPPLVVPLVPPVALLVDEDVAPLLLVEPPPPVVLEVLLAVPEVPDDDAPSPFPLVAVPPPGTRVAEPTLVETGGRSSSLESPHATMSVAPAPKVRAASVPSLSFTAISSADIGLRSSVILRMLVGPTRRRKK